ncbi:hypothetical protein N7455_005813 [Penicillium solitum]|uniref:uncharacterized protein n=1 Tax=Penicillium solitum TaxID=60172 RepID=UPI0017EBF0C2|nr:hypothetical protein HAV15_010099 [Penicillium sp. str. \
MDFVIGPGSIRTLAQWNAPWTLIKGKAWNNQDPLGSSEASKDETAFGAAVCLLIIDFPAL